MTYTAHGTVSAMEILLVVVCSTLFGKGHVVALQLLHCHKDKSRVSNNASHSTASFLESLFAKSVAQRES